MIYFYLKKNNYNNILFCPKTNDELPLSVCGRLLDSELIEGGNGFIVNFVFKFHILSEILLHQ